MTDRIWTWLDRVDRTFIREHLERHQFMPIMRLLERELFAGPGAQADAGRT
jgi:hypothetical protein